MISIKPHTYYMQKAINEAKKAEMRDEVPVGSVLVANSGEILSLAYNQTITLSDPTAHAEMLVLRETARKLKNYRLLNTTLYSTIEPCVMCMGAVIHARVSQVVFGAFDLKWGAAGSLYDIANDPRLNHRIHIVSGVCRDECKALIQNFFEKKRNR